MRRCTVIKQSGRRKKGRRRRRRRLCEVERTIVRASPPSVTVLSPSRMITSPFAFLPAAGLGFFAPDSTFTAGAAGAFLFPLQRDGQKLGKREWTHGKRLIVEHLGGRLLQ